jgi:glycosyltransferase involved in cell wall biosynthesis
VTDVTKIAAVPGSGLDIIVFVAHLELSKAELGALTGRMLGELDWPAISGRICLVVPDGSELEGNADWPIVVVRSSAAASMFRERSRVLEASPHDILISFGAYLPTGDTVAQLQMAARSDELISAVAPRIAIGSRGELMTLGPRGAPNTSGLIDPRYASKLAPAYHLPELLCPCMLLSGTMIGNVDVPDNFDHFPDLILAFLRAGRRRGLLVRIDNRLIVSAAAEFESARLQQDTAKMLQLFDDYEVAARRLAASPALADERRFQTLRNASPVATGSLLLDCTNIPPSFSGSAEHALGVLRGIAQIDHAAWDVSVTVADKARSFFSLDDRFPGIRFLSNADESYYDCAIRLSQPWLTSHLINLNDRARSIAVTILDTIGPDVIYAVPEEAEDAFQFAAEHADGLIYISEFSRDQFRRRFALRPGLIESVIYLSLDPLEYVPDACDSGGEWILIFGNAYDHKDLERTTRIVSSAFPFEQIKVVGRQDLGGMNVEAFDSGALETEFIETLFRRAKCVVFPSFYEGFGLPLMKGLAYGKAVIARRSRVFREVVGRFPNNGRLIEFENSLDLVPALGKVLHGKDETPSRHATGVVTAAHHGWKECAAQILQFADRMRESEDVDVWRERDRALRYAKARRQ